MSAPEHGQIQVILPRGAAHSVTAMLIPHGIEFHYIYDGGQDKVIVHKGQVPMLEKFIEAFRET